jgi:CBS domain-containing protein
MTEEPEARLQDLMHGDVVTVDVGTGLRVLVAIMAAEEVGSVLVTDAGGLVGIVTERDVVVALASGDELDTLSAADVMSEEPMCADVDDGLERSVERMVQARVLHLPVLREGKAVGVVSARDLLDVLTEPRWLTALPPPPDGVVEVDQVVRP